MSENLLPYGGAFPEVADSAWVAPGAYVVRDKGRLRAARRLRL
jgi:hypothetical protein